MQRSFSFHKLPAFAALSIFSVCAAASATEDSASLRKIAEAFVARQVTELPGQATATVGMIDTRLRLPKCANVEGFLPPGTRLWGNATIGIRCQEPSVWSIYVPVTVKVMAPVVTTVKPLPQGHILTNADIAVHPGDLTQLPSGVIADVALAIGKSLASGLPAGQALRADLLRPLQIVKTGQIVRLVAQGEAFQINTEGKALNSAAPGQSISVRTSGGKVVSGVVKADGSVEVAF
jgi:flagellar basal body P-ring formation protein FlgA